VSARPVDRTRHELVEQHFLVRGRRRLPAREFDHVGDQPGQLVELCDDAGENRTSLLRTEPVDVVEHFGIGAKACQRRTQFVACVGDQLPLRRE